MNTRHGEQESPLPLTSLTFQILIALADRPLHGYGIIQVCKDDSNGIIEPRPGAVYSALERLLAYRYIEEVGHGTDTGLGNPRRIYGLTSAGRLVLEWEIGRLAEAVSIARRRLRA